MTTTASLDARDLSTALEEVVRLVRRAPVDPPMSLTSASTLRRVADHGPARLSDLAVEQGVSQPAMTQLVRKLEGAGLLARATDPADGRVVLLHATDAGRGLLARRRDLRTAWVADLLDRLDADDQHALAAAVGALHRLAALSGEPRTA